MKFNIIFTAFQYIFGAAAIIYFLSSAMRLGLANRFTWVWLAAGVFFTISGTAGVLLIKNGRHVNRTFNIILMLIFGVLAVIFVCVLFQIIRADKKGPGKNADYIIILGGRVRGTVPSADLEKRLEAGKKYLDKFPECRCIVTGGQGIGEDASEGKVMKEWLVKNGEDPERITAEVRSETTVQNLRFSARLLKAEGVDIRKKKCVIVSSSYHIYRALRIAGKEGYTSVSGLGSKVSAFSAPNGYVREVCAVLYNKLKGNMQ